MIPNEMVVSVGNPMAVARFHLARPDPQCKQCTQWIQLQRCHCGGGARLTYYPLDSGAKLAAPDQAERRPADRKVAPWFVSWDVFCLFVTFDV